jgi:hypothetical protein
VPHGSSFLQDENIADNAKNIVTMLNPTVMKVLEVGFLFINEYKFLSEKDELLSPCYS